MDWAFVAEEADAYQELPPSVERQARDDVILVQRARDRAAYRALVRARCEAAGALGAPALVTQTQAASRPILERLGFQATGVMDVLVDHAAVGGEERSH